MANSVNAKVFLPGAASASVADLGKDAQGWLVETTAPDGAACPDCGVVSKSRHSSYVRTVTDLPVQGVAARIKVRVGRWRCRNRGCQRQIFCQRLEHTGRHGRETRRCREVVEQVAYALGGRPAERLIMHLGVRRSRHTLLRAIKRSARSCPTAESVAAVGVDDWAWRKWYKDYGTILVDLKRGVVADLLPDRSAASFAKWLRDHPGVKVVSRDRHGVYAEGARAGAPAAKQVADRFHLIQNLSKAVEGELARQRHHLLIPAQEFVGTDTTAGNDEAPETDIAARAGTTPNKEKEDIRQQRWQQQVQLFEMVKGLYAQGLRASDIVRQTGLSRGRVDKWLRLEQCLPRSRKTPRPGMAQDFCDPLQRLWERGCHKGATLLSEIRKLGYIGSLTSLNRFLAPWRAAQRMSKRAAQSLNGSRAAVSAMRHVSPQEAAALLGKPKPMLNERQSTIVEFLKRTPDFATMRRLLLSFRSILCSGKVFTLRRWARQAEAAGIASISRWLRPLKKDWQAVENAVRYSWSNGPTEGHVNRLKNLKRQMYGRAGVELLRARLLPYSPLHQT